MSTTGASTMAAPSIAPASIYTVQELLHLRKCDQRIITTCTDPLNSDTSESTYDLAVIQKLHRSIVHHGLRSMPRLGDKMALFVDPVNNGFLFPPSQDPGFNTAAGSAKSNITLSRCGAYLPAMLGQSAPSAVMHEGTDACKRCQKSKTGRYSSCRRAYDSQGNPLGLGACMTCYSTNHAGDCSFISAGRKRRSRNVRGEQEQEETDLGDEQSVEFDQSLDVVEFELERYHHLSTFNNFDLVVEVRSPLPVLDINSRELLEIPAGFEIRIGVRLPGTDTYQVEVPNLLSFAIKAEGSHLRSNVEATPATEAWAAATPDSYIPGGAFHTMSLVRSCKGVICRSLAVDKLQISAGCLFVFGKVRYLPGFGMLMVVTHEGSQPMTRGFLPLPEHLMNQLLVEGTFEYADVLTQRPTYGTVDLTNDETVISDGAITSSRDMVVCGVNCKGLSVGTGEKVQMLIKGGLIPLFWSRNSRGESFVHL